MGRKAGTQVALPPSWMIQEAAKAAQEAVEELSRVHHSPRTNKSPVSKPTGKGVQACPCGRTCTPESHFCPDCGQGLQKRGVTPESLPNQKRQKKNTKLTTWRCEYKHGVDIRAGPAIAEPRMPHALEPGEEFLVEREEMGTDGILYLKLADGRGWVFDQKPSLGVICAPAREKAALPRRSGAQEPAAPKPKARNRRKATPTPTAQADSRSRSRSGKRASEATPLRRRAASPVKAPEKSPGLVALLSQVQTPRRPTSPASPTVQATAKSPGLVALLSQAQETPVRRSSSRSPRSREAPKASPGLVAILSQAQTPSRRQTPSPRCREAAEKSPGLVAMLSQAQEARGRSAERRSRNQKDTQKQCRGELKAMEAAALGPTSRSPKAEKRTSPMRKIQATRTSPLRKICEAQETPKSSRGDARSSPRSARGVHSEPRSPPVEVHKPSKPSKPSKPPVAAAATHVPRLTKLLATPPKEPRKDLPRRAASQDFGRVSSLIPPHVRAMLAERSPKRRQNDAPDAPPERPPGRRPTARSPGLFLPEVQEISSEEKRSAILSERVWREGRTAEMRDNVWCEILSTAFLQCSGATTEKLQESVKDEENLFDDTELRLYRQRQQMERHAQSAWEDAQRLAEHSARVEEAKKLQVEKTEAAQKQRHEAKHGEAEQPLVFGRRAGGEDPRVEAALQRLRQAVVEVEERAAERTAKLRKQQEVAEEKAREQDALCEKDRGRLESLEEEAAERLKLSVEATWAAKLKAQEKPLSCAEEATVKRLEEKATAEQKAVEEEASAQRVVAPQLAALKQGGLVQEGYEVYHCLALLLYSLLSEVLATERGAHAADEAWKRAEERACAEEARPRLGAFLKRLPQLEVGRLSCLRHSAERLGRAVLKSEEVRCLVEEELDGDFERFRCSRHRLGKWHGNFEIDLDSVLKMLWFQQGRCFYSDIPLRFAELNVDWMMSLERLDNNKTYTKENTVLVALEFNSADHSDVFETQLDMEEAEYQAMAGRRQGPPDPSTVVFLDVDGVLHAKGDELDHFRASNMRALRRIVLTSNATVVLSSSWRRRPPLLQRADAVLQNWGLAGVADQTPDLKAQGLKREDEILIWLRRHPEVRHWLALDDMELTSSASSLVNALMAQHVIQTDPEIGLREMSQVSRALRVLQKSRGFVEEALERKRVTQRSGLCA
ncbi:unnamed protein product [Durusdinium trenchii]|uniref:Uncharacterized protein n=1 Tax=Durusdinium trenchii TaxID=1381693 RepID=A0ABP0N5B3_9DINO